MNRLFSAAGIGLEMGTQGQKVKIMWERFKEKFAGSMKPSRAVLGIVLAAAVLAGAVWMNAAQTGYAAVLNGICKMVNDREADLDGIAETLLPGFAEEQYHVIMDTIGEIEIVDDAVGDLENDIMEAYLKLEDSFGSNVKVSWEILEKEKMSELQIRRTERNYQEFSEEYLQNAVNTLDNYEDISWISDRYGLAMADVRTVLDSVEALAEDCEYMEISKGFNLVIEIQAEGSRDSYSDEAELSVICANGEWMLDYSAMGGNLLTEVGEELDSLLWWWF